MAQLEEALYTRLSGFAGLTALIGTRIFPDAIPQDQPLPALAYARISTVRPSAGGVDTGLAGVRMQLTAWATTYLSAKNVKDQVRAALQRFRGTVAGVEILDSFMDGEGDMPFESATGPGTGTPGIYGTRLDALIWHREA